MSAGCDHTIEEREAEVFDEAALEQRKHFSHAPHQHHEGCPGGRSMTIEHHHAPDVAGEAQAPSELSQWPVQLSLVSPSAPYLRGANLLVTADCVPFAYGGFHQRFLRGHAIVVGCPKLDDAQAYQDKLAEIIRLNHLSSLTVLHMEVPCCFGLGRIVAAAIQKAGSDLQVKDVTITIDGQVREG